ncbi:MAG TPA: energy transducer TonB [Candidatus Acidoferrum sp.]|jgi:TonB family protein|nr:energy transducer TonB [Candidatus Acidoferrum sp.]
MRNLKRPFARNITLASALAFLLGGVVVLAQEPPDKSPEVVYEVGLGSDVTPPKPIYNPDPTYVDKARKKKINGVVVVAMIVTAEGKVRDVKVIKSLDPDLDKQAIAAVRTWKFEPATKDGKPVAVHLKTEVDFRLY